MGWADRLLSRRPAATADESEDLFDEAFLRRLELLQVIARRLFRGRQRAERKTRKVGSGQEFADHREYSPGDDIRYLDWIKVGMDADRREQAAKMADEVNREFELSLRAARTGGRDDAR